MALDMVAAVGQRTDGRTTQIRIGIDTGHVVAGVIGRGKFMYDLWEDMVNTSSRMGSHGVPGSIQVTERTYRRMSEGLCAGGTRTVQVKGKGDMQTWLLAGRR